MLRTVKKNNFSGFTLMEVLTVLFVISIGLLGVVSLIVQNVQSQSFNKKNIIAYELAQESIELIRQTRDTNWRATSPARAWDAGLASGDYYMDYRNDVPTLTATGQFQELYLDQNGYYIHDFSNTYPDSGFSRLVSINKIDNSKMSVIAQVKWGDRGKTFSYVLETLLYNWR